MSGRPRALQLERKGADAVPVPSADQLGCEVCAPLRRPPPSARAFAGDARRLEGTPKAGAPRELRSYRAGVLAGAIAFIALLGAIKDVYALLDQAGRGEMAWGFLMLRYSSLQRVWFGYKVTGDAAWLAIFPHVALYAASVYGLVGRRRWCWYLLFTYVLYIPVSQSIYMVLYPLGYLTGRPMPDSFVRGEWLFLAISVPLELAAAGLLWRYRDLFISDGRESEAKN